MAMVVCALLLAGGAYAAGLPVDLKGNLAVHNGRLAIQVVWAEVD